MNADPFKPTPREVLESKLTARLLGELPPEDEALLREALQRDPDLARLEGELREAIRLVRETAAQPAEPLATSTVLPRMSGEKRDRLLRQLARAEAPDATPGPARTAVIPVAFEVDSASSTASGVWLALAACIVAILVLVTLGQDLGHAKSRGLSLSRLPAEEGTSLAMFKRAADPSPPQSPPSAVGALAANRRLDEMAVNGTSVQAQNAPAEGMVRLGRLEVMDVDAGSLPQAGKEVSPLPRLQTRRERLQDSEVPVDQGRTAQDLPSSLGSRLMSRYGLASSDKEKVTAPSEASAIAENAQTASPGQSLRYYEAGRDSSAGANAALSARDTGLGVGGGGDGAAGVRTGSLPRVDTPPLPAVDGGVAIEPKALGFGVMIEDRAGAVVENIGDLRRPAVQETGEVPADATRLSRGDARRLADVALRPSAEGLSAIAKAEIEGKEAPREVGLRLAESEARKDSAPPAVAGVTAMPQILSQRTEQAGNALVDWDTSTGTEALRVPGSTIDVRRAAPLAKGIAPSFGEIAGAHSRVSAVSGLVDSLQRLEDNPPQAPAPGAPLPTPEILASENATSTFSLNVSDVSFKLAGASLDNNLLPAPATIRTEEFVNAFQYRDPEASAGSAVGFTWERAQYPFAQQRDILRLAVRTAARGREPGRPVNLVLVLDSSGSMERADRVRIIQEALRSLAGQLQPVDRVSIVSFARTARLWVDGLPGSQAGELVERVGHLTPEGGTNLEDALRVGYETALKHFFPDGINRVAVLTDGAANLGDVQAGTLKFMVESYRKRGVALDCFGIGWDGYQDELLEALSRNGDGRYGFMNTPEAAATDFASQLAGALQVAAENVKVQVEFNPRRVSVWRQVGYAKHQLTREEFRDNAVDAAELGAAESGNTLYVVGILPTGDGPVATVRVRYRLPGTSHYAEQEWAVPYTGTAVALDRASPALRLATVAATFGESLAQSPYASGVTGDQLLPLLTGVADAFQPDPRPARLEAMVRQAQALRGQ